MKPEIIKWPDDYGAWWIVENNGTSQKPLYTPIKEYAAVIDSLDALGLILDRVREFGNLDSVRDEAIIEQAMDSYR